MRLPYNYRCYWTNGKWGEGKLTRDDSIKLNECATCLHYGQETFEGMKAYRTKDNHINLFRPDQNAQRFHDSCQRLLMPAFPKDRFIAAVKKMVKANDDFVPPYGNGVTHFGTGSANFFAVTKDGKTFVTPKSPSILPSITKYSLLYLVKDRLHMNAVQGDVKTPKGWIQRVE